MADHEFHALWWNLGPFGRQDIHLHVCTTETHRNCKTELVADGAACNPKAPHYALHLGVDSPWKRKEHEGDPLESVLTEKQRSAQPSGEKSTPREAGE